MADSEAGSGSGSGFVPRAPLAAEVPEVMDFLDKMLRPNQGWSIAAEYPQVFAPQNRENLRILKNDGEVIAHAATKFLIVKNQFGLFKIAAIGSVVTSPKHRNNGHSQTILKSCLEIADQEGADFAILWTDMYDLYRKLGFELAGREISIVIDAVPELPAHGLKIMQSEKVAPEAILRLYAQHPTGTVRTAEDIRRHLSIPNSKIYTAWDKSNQLLAYAVEGKGADLRGYIHEWSGGVSALLPLLAHIRKEYGQAITLIAPTQAQNIIRQLQSWPIIMNEGFLGMIRPVNEHSLFVKITRRARQLGINDFVMEKMPTGQVRVGTPNDMIILNTTAELTRLIFGPHSEGALKPEYQELFPIPMWIWGWDSV